MSVLLSRYIDPVLGVFTGIFAYYLAENNPRTGLKPEQKLIPLIRWKLDKRKDFKHLTAGKAEGN